MATNNTKNKRRLPTIGEYMIICKTSEDEYMETGQYIRFLTRQVFSSLDEASAYAKNVHPSYGLQIIEVVLQMDRE